MTTKTPKTPKTPAAAPAVAAAPAQEPQTSEPSTTPDTPTTPPAAPPAQQARLADIRRLEDARSLPEVPADAELEPLAFAIGSIERFVAGENDRRVMQVVGFSGGYASQEVPQEATEG
jgi:hypothetical protein